MFNLNYLLNILLMIVLQGTGVEQKKYGKSTFENTNFAFGGGLYMTVNEKKNNDSNLVIAAEFAIKQLSTQFPTLRGLNREEGEGCKVISSSVSKVLYTRDGKSPHLLQVVDQATGRVRSQPLVWGVMYTFSLLSSDQTPVQHSFTVFQYWDGLFHLFQHIFQTVAIVETEQSELNSEARLEPPRTNFLAESSSRVETISVTKEPPSFSGCETNKERSHHFSKSQRAESHDSVSDFSQRDLSNKDVGSLCFRTNAETCDCICHLPDAHLSASKSVTLKTVYFSLMTGIICDQNTVNPGQEKLQTTDAGSERSRLNPVDRTEDLSFASERVNLGTTRNSTATLKILNYNIWNVNVVSGGDAQYVRRIRHLAALCEDTDPDVIALQEVRFQDGKGGRLGPNQMTHLSKLLPAYQYVFQPAQVQLDGLPNMVVEGVAFMSKHPITGHSRLFLRRDPQDQADGHQRVLLHVEVQLPRVGKVHLFNTHLSLSHKARATSVLQAWTYMKTFPGPAFLMGDFNSEAHNIEVEFLDGRAVLRGVHTSGLRDVWRMKYGPANPGFTFSTLEAHLSKRIDLIFMREHERVSLADVWLLDDKKRRGHAASDHLGLIAQFSIEEL